MALFARRERAPQHVVGLLGGQRVVSWADTEDSVVVASPSGLWWPVDGDGLRMIGWEHVDKATWRDGMLTVTEADVVDDLLLVDRAPVVARLTVVRDLPPVVRKRVQNNIARTELVQVPGGAVRFVGRRRPGADGLAWWARLEPGTRDSVPLRAAVRARVEVLRAG